MIGPPWVCCAFFTVNFTMSYHKANELWGPFKAGLLLFTSEPVRTQNLGQIDAREGSEPSRQKNECLSR